MYDFIDSHNRTFWGELTDDTDAPSVRYFALVPNTDSPTTIDVVASSQGDSLQLSYFVSQDEQSVESFGNFDQADTLTRADFLWQKTCLECFFDFGQKSYVELNFTPQGEYNLYRFDDYRTPDTTPPTWADGTVSVATGTALDGYMTYHLIVKVDTANMADILNIHPTAIIYHGDTPNFYAVQHTNPPDFHNKTVWQEF